MTIMTKPVILTGLRANNDLTIGNYLGALLPLVDMANTRAGEYQVNLFMPDLHSFITPIDNSQFQTNIYQALRDFAAAGLPLDNPDVHIYRQSFIPAHSELTWILDCFTGMGEMSRMTQYKDKASKLSEDRINVGLFNYPVLMAADILLYGAKYIPVGDDQSQHLEFTRNIAERMNAKFDSLSGPESDDSLFVVPEPIAKQHEFFGKDQGLRIRDLIDPAKKMSKSDESTKGVIFLSDTPDVAHKKVMGATTDSLNEVHYDIQKQPGISNLLTLLALLSHRELSEVIAEYEGQTLYGSLKTAVAEAVVAFLEDFQTKLKNVNESQLQQKLEASELAMRDQASHVLYKVQKAVGLR